MANANGRATARERVQDLYGAGQVIPPVELTLANAIDDLRSDMLREFREARDDMAGYRSEVQTYREEAKSGRRLTWTIAGVLIPVLGIILGIAQALGR